MSAHLTFGMVIQAVAVAAATSLPFLAGVRATTDDAPSAATTRTRRARPWTRAHRRSGNAGAGMAPSSPAPATDPDGRGDGGPPAAAPVGLQRRRVHG
jgi:hypothetical protein